MVIISEQLVNSVLQALLNNLGILKQRGLFGFSMKTPLNPVSESFVILISNLNKKTQ